MMRCLAFVFLGLLLHNFASAQVKDPVIPKKDTLIVNKNTRDTSTHYIKLDTVNHNRHSPRKAAIYSAILPGLGQIYNKKYWKLPLVYAAVGIPIYTFFDNQRWYKRSRDAARMLANSDTLNYKGRVDPQLYVYFTTPNALGSLLQFRNQVRRNMDYSILFTLLFWGLNVVDATVDAHLKDFDISDNLSMKIKPTLLSGGSMAGLSVVFTIGNHPKSISSR